MPISGRHGNGKTLMELKIQKSVVFKQVYWPMVDEDYSADNNSKLYPREANVGNGRVFAYQW